MKSSTAWSLICCLVVLIAIIGGLYYYEHKPLGPASVSITSANGTSQQPQGDSTPVSENLILGIQSSATLGNFLTAYNGMTLYTYSPDKGMSMSMCTGNCAQNWLPYTVESQSDINVGAATGGKVSTITRADGSLQVTYNGMPLYFYIGDKVPGDANGQGIGGVWYVAKP